MSKSKFSFGKHDDWPCLSQEDVSEDIKYVLEHSEKSGGADASPNRLGGVRKNTGLAHEMARADATTTLWSLVTETEMLRMAVLKLSPSSASGDPPLLSDTAFGFTQELPEFIFPSTLPLSTAGEYMDICRDNKCGTYPLGVVKGDELPLDLTDVDIKQDAKDMKRDTVTVNGVLYEGAHVGYDGIVSAVQFALPQRVLNAENVARVIISIVNRTNSGGLCFEKVTEVYQQPDAVFIAPCSSVAEPLDIVITNEDKSSSGVWALVRAHTQYAVYSEMDHQELLRVDADFLCRLAIDVDYDGQADFDSDRSMAIVCLRHTLSQGSDASARLAIAGESLPMIESPGGSTECDGGAAEHRLRNEGLTVESYQLHIDLTAAINSDSELIGRYQNREFEGECKIITRHTATLDSIRLNSAELAIDKSEVRVLQPDSEPMSILHTIIQRPELEEIELRLSQAISEGSLCELIFRYSGRINSNSRGVYESESAMARYLQRDPSCDSTVFTLRRGMIVTQCCPVDARRILPCMDEPDMKASFTLSISAPVGVTVLANMPVQHTEPFTYSRVSALDEEYEESIDHDDDIDSCIELAEASEDGSEQKTEDRRRKHESMSGRASDVEQWSLIAEYAASDSADSADCGPSVKRRKVVEELCAGARTIFEPTPKMSTYLLAFAVGDFVQLSGKDTPGRDPRVSVWCRRSQTNKCNFALEVASKCLVYYESELFHTKYPLPKCDLLAVTDHHFGAMENWGLITFREQDLLISEDSGSAESVYRITVTVCHELAHMWFGNIVTIKWWNDIWLNEGFATWTSYAAASYIFPDSSFWAAFQTSMVDRAMQLDCLDSSHPIQVTCLDGREAFDNFDAISYNKSAAVIHMLTTHIGMTRFKERIHDYLDRHKWDGYPYIIAELTDEKTVKIRQAAVGESSSSSDRQWIVPLRYRIISNDSYTVSSTILMPNCDITIPLAEGEVLHLNPDSTGFYSVVYSSSLMHRLTELARPLLTSLDLIGLVRDSTMAMSDARLPPNEWYRLLVELFSTGDIDETVGIQLGNSLSHIFPLLPRTHEAPVSRIRDAYGKFCRLLVGRHCSLRKASSPVGSVASNSNYSIAGRGLRGGSLRIMLDCQDRGTILACSRLFDEGGYSLPDSVPEDIHGWVYAGAVACPVKGVARARLLLEHYEHRHPASIDRQQKTLAVIGEVDDADIQRQILSLLLPKQVVRPQDWRCVVESCAHNRSLGLAVVWDWLTTWWPQIQERFRSSGAMGIGCKLLVIVCENMSTEEDLDKVLQFLNKNPDPRMERTSSQLIDKIKLNAAALDPVYCPMIEHAPGK
ncbi:hypothetical protein FOL47_004112, partial [Perkinsus chesapeaki]